MVLVVWLWLEGVAGEFTLRCGFSQADPAFGNIRNQGLDGEVTHSFFPSPVQCPEIPVS